MLSAERGPDLRSETVLGAGKEQEQRASLPLMGKYTKVYEWWYDRVTIVLDFDFQFHRKELFEYTNVNAIPPLCLAYSSCLSCPLHNILVVF